MNDAGDETARRYRYQFAYAGILCCSLLDDTLDVVEVFCEHHEDVLVKHADGQFTGVQVKTRKPEGSAWKANDEHIEAACVRFVELESGFPDRFRAFTIVTNHSFYSNAKTGTCLPYLLSLAGGCDCLASADKKLRAFLHKLSRKAGCAEEVAFKAMRKTRLDHEAPKLNDITAKLADTLALRWRGAQRVSCALLQRVARHVVSACHEASSLSHADVLPPYIVLSPEPVAAEVRCRINGKRIDREKLEALLDSVGQRPELLEGPLADVPWPTASGASLLTRKLDAGGFSATSVDSAINLCAKATHLALQATKKHGNEEGLRRYDHLRSIVLRDCADGHEACAREDARFGREMLAEVRARLRARREDGENLFGWRDEHLEGLAYVLTGECRVRWSSDSPWEEAP